MVTKLSLKELPEEKSALWEEEMNVQSHRGVNQSSGIGKE